MLDLQNKSMYRSDLIEVRQTEHDNQNWNSLSMKNDFVLRVIYESKKKFQARGIYDSVV